MALEEAYARSKRLSAWAEEPYEWAQERFERAEAAYEQLTEPFSGGDKGFTGAKEGTSGTDEGFEVAWAQSMTWKRKPPVIRLNSSVYQKGISLTKQAIVAIEERLERNPLLPKWDILIRPISG